MPSPSATGSPRLGARESVDEGLEGVVVVDAAAAQDEVGGAAARSAAACHRVGMRASLPTTWTACPPTSTKPPSVPGGALCCSFETVVMELALSMLSGETCAWIHRGGL